ncbi:hypothetical protein G6O69_30490 [Pseudenhygromyxa sp. WMMC2535]|uniref:hypothetical protein n=1 Tax=Pseudenhygromyxa sp. WMMC2535 TaxID=2712867 RepID=UPI001554C1E7|nr:hypothetical protein [Pseudenhygromyxa sp. WMMC2535]NVB42191.1 hypothetical protein [Pseudenhygromyxa sp. WMMC2535]
MAEHSTSPATQDAPIDPGVSEFGELLAQFVAATPHILGAVLSDGVDDTIDTAHRPQAISALDLCIAGAQIGQAMSRLTIDTIIFGFGRAQVVIESEDQILLSKVLWEQYLFTAVTTTQVNLARVMRNFDETADQLLALLR